MPLVVSLSITGILAPDPHCPPLSDQDAVIVKPIEANLLLVEVFRVEM